MNWQCTHSLTVDALVVDKCTVNITVITSIFRPLQCTGGREYATRRAVPSAHRRDRYGSVSYCSGAVTVETGVSDL